MDDHGGWGNVVLAVGIILAAITLLNVTTYIFTPYLISAYAAAFLLVTGLLLKIQAVPDRPVSKKSAVVLMWYTSAASFMTSFLIPYLSVRMSYIWLSIPLATLGAALGFASLIIVRHE